MVEKLDLAEQLFFIQHAEGFKIDDREPLQGELDVLGLLRPEAEQDLGFQVADFDILVGDSLTEFAEKNNVDLIIIATHGRSGIKRLVLGSVADRILRTSKIPILMVQPQDSATKA